MAMHLTAVIITKNEAHNITDCIAALRDWTDAVVVLDSCSRDETRQIAQKAGARVIARPFDDYARQRQAALDSIDSDWVLFVDADERATPALAQEVLKASRDANRAGYSIPRRNFIVGREIRGGGFAPDYQLRLLQRRRARYDLSREVHEIVILDGEEGRLGEPLLHYNYADWPQFHRKQRVYARYEARILAEQGTRARPHHLVLQPAREFRRRFFDLQGWRDGLHGLHIALLLAWYYGFVPYWVLLRADA
ncbi:MAG: glycosyltransferase family 2 protein [Caldilineaceae bacterium]|nr:glycosyltransferase family 2 protein [Caldilineaceae bacterium]